MPRPAPHRLELPSYPLHDIVRTRYQDLDAMGHLNNVAFAAMFEDARVRFNWAIGHAGAGGLAKEQTIGGEFRAVVAANTINYLAEGTYPANVTIGTGIGRIGNRSWDILAVMHQDGRAIATCDTVIVLTHPPEGPLPHAFRARLEAHRISEPLA